MSNEEIIEGNKLIAEFMGMDTNPIEIECEECRFYFSCSHLQCGLPKEELFKTISLEYHSSWDWLMPCIGKISNICEEPEELDGLKYALLTNNITEAWKFIVNYLENS